MSITSIDNTNKKSLSKEEIDLLFIALNKSLRKKMKKLDRDIKLDLYVVGGAAVVAGLNCRTSTMDVDAYWTEGSTMRDCINEVAEENNLCHEWCNKDFVRTKSFTLALMTHSHVYHVFDRLIVRMVNLDLLLAMKLVAFRTHKQTDMLDAQNIINILRKQGHVLNEQTILTLVINFYGSLDVLQQTARDFISLQKG